MQFLPTTTALRCLDASARWGSFTRAAKELNLTQSAVSNQILNLERQLGVALFDREHGRLELTPAGRLFWEETLAALQQLNRATRRITDKSDKTATLTVSAPSSFANSLGRSRLAICASGCGDRALRDPSDGDVVLVRSLLCLSTVCIASAGASC